MDYCSIITAKNWRTVLSVEQFNGKFCCQASCLTKRFVMQTKLTQGVILNESWEEQTKTKQSWEEQVFGFLGRLGLEWD